MRPGVSVIIPVFGNYARTALLTCTIRRWLAQDEAREALLVYLGDKSRTDLETLARRENATYVFIKCESDRAGPATWSPGRVRNAGLICTRQDWVYISDADTFPARRNFLTKLLERASNGTPIQIHAPMIRVYDDDGSFLNAGLAGVDLGLPITDPRTPCLHTSRNGHLRPLWHSEVSFCIDGSRSVCQASELEFLKVCEAAGTPSNQIVFRPDFHYGSIFAPKTAFETVGGYHEGYRNWGHEDDDIIHKLSLAFGCEQIYNPDDLRPIIHMEHTRPYNDAWLIANKTLFEQRRGQVLEAIVSEDRKNFENMRRQVTMHL